MASWADQGRGVGGGGGGGGGGGLALYELYNAKKCVSKGVVTIKSPHSKCIPIAPCFCTALPAK